MKKQITEEFIPRSSVGMKHSAARDKYLIYSPLLGWVTVKQGSGSANWLMFLNLTT